MKEEEDFFLKEGTSKDSQGFRPYQNKPVGGNSSQSSTNHFPRVGGNRISNAPGAVFNPTTRGMSVVTPPPNGFLKASISSPVGGRLPSFRRDWQANKCSSSILNIITNAYVLPFLSKLSLIRFPLIQAEYKAHQKDKALATCIQSLLAKNGKCKISQVLQSPVSSTQASPKADASHALKQAQHFSTSRKVQNGNSRVHQGLPDSRGMVSSIGLSDVYLHVQILRSIQWL